MRIILYIFLVFLSGILIYQHGANFAQIFIPQVVDQLGNFLYEIQKISEFTEKSAEINSRSPVLFLPVPVIGVESDQIVDTWGAAREEGRKHEGTDIFAKRGTYVISPTDAVVIRIGRGSRGGNYVLTRGPAGERYYFAHLDSVDQFLEENTFITSKTILGQVGNTGNASGTPPHLHFGIYTQNGPINPYPRLAPN